MNRLMTITIDENTDPTILCRYQDHNDVADFIINESFGCCKSHIEEICKMSVTTLANWTGE